MDDVGTSSLFFHSSGGRGSDGDTAYNDRTPHLAESLRLNDAEIQFFDEVLDAIRPDSCSFVELKDAFNDAVGATAHLDRVARTLPPGVQDRRKAAELRLWNSLLAMVQVRGESWAERWDTVRVLLGLDPRGSDSDASIDMQDVSAVLPSTSYALRSFASSASHAPNTSRSYAPSTSRPYAPEPVAASRASYVRPLSPTPYTPAPWRLQGSPPWADDHASSEGSVSDDDVWAQDADRSTRDLDTVWQPGTSAVSPVRVGLAPRLYERGRRTSTALDLPSPRQKRALAKAAHFHNEHTLTASLGHWQCRTAAVRKRYELATRVDRQRLRAHAWAAWYDRYAGHQQALAHAAQYAARVRVARAFDAWAARMSQRKAQRDTAHEQMLAAALDAVVARRSQRLERLAWTVRTATHPDLAAGPHAPHGRALLQRRRAARRVGRMAQPLRRGTRTRALRRGVRTHARGPCAAACMGAVAWPGHGTHRRAPRRGLLAARPAAACLDALAAACEARRDSKHCGGAAVRRPLADACARCAALLDSTGARRVLGAGAQCTARAHRVERVVGALYRAECRETRYVASLTQPRWTRLPRTGPGPCFALRGMRGSSGRRTGSTSGC